MNFGTCERRMFTFPPTPPGPGFGRGPGPGSRSVKTDSWPVTFAHTTTATLGARRHRGVCAPLPSVVVQFRSVPFDGLPALHGPPARSPLQEMISWKEVVDKLPARGNVDSATGQVCRCCGKKYCKLHATTPLALAGWDAALSLLCFRCGSEQSGNKCTNNAAKARARGRIREF